MATRRKTYLALLRGINVGGHNKIAMAALRSLCADIGWQDVRSYIQSGNLVFTASGSAAGLEKQLEHAIERRFSLAIPVIVRDSGAWSKYVRSNPFPTASDETPNHVMLALCKATPKRDALGKLRARAADTERIVRAGDALWVHFANGAGRSKLTTAVFDRAAGQPVTARNWRTVLKLGALAE